MSKVVIFTNKDPLSNEYPCDMIIDGVCFHCAEQAFYYKLFESFEEISFQILEAKNAEEVKRCASLYNFCKTYSGDASNYVLIKPQWYYLIKKYRDVTIHIMHNVLTHKFAIPKFRELLLQTGDSDLRLDRNKSALPHGSSGSSFSWMWWMTTGGLICDGYLGWLLKDIRSGIVYENSKLDFYS